MRKLCLVGMLFCMLALCLCLLPTQAHAATEEYFTYEVTDGEATITDCDTTISGDITIPSVLNGCPVTCIASYAFSSCTSLTSITIPNCVTSIENQAFYYCTSLTGLWVDENNRYYSSDSYGCLFDKEKTVLIQAPAMLSGSYTLPDSVTTIGDSAFSNCNSLSYNIYDNGNYLGNGSNPYFLFVNTTSRDIISCDIHPKTMLINDYAFYYCKSLTSVIIPDSVTSIGKYAFDECTSLNSATIGNSVTSIGERAFSICTSLTTVIIGDSVAIIGENAFYKCSSLISVIVGNGVTSIGPGAFSSCTSLTSVDIGDSVDSIGEFAFSRCDKLTSITIPDSVNSIGKSVFFGCSGLESIVIPFVGASRTFPYGSYRYPLGYIFGTSSYSGSKRTVQYYSDSVAVNSTSGTTSTTYYIPSSLKSVTVTGGNIPLGAFSNCDNLTNITIPNNATSIGIEAFASCVNLTAITIPDSVSFIGERAFHYCFSLTSIIIPDSVASIDNYAFNYCTGLTSIVIPDSVTSIGNYAFNYCTGLTSIVIPDSVTSIGDYAFNSCTGLTSVIIPDSVTCIGSYAFRNCAGLTNITISDSLTSIGNYAFDRCSGLKYFTIPNSVAEIGRCAFSNCSGLEKVWFAGSAPSTATSGNVFDYVTAKIYYPAADSSWTEDERQNYGGTLTWIPYDTLIEVNGAMYTSMADALAEYTQGQYLKFQSNILAEGELSADLYIDLNGYTLTGTITTNGYKIYGMDSTTDNYTCDSIGYFNCVDENGNAIVPESHFKSDITGEVKRYMTVSTDDGYTFHRFYLGITHTSLNPTVTGLGYKAVYYGDKMVIAQLDADNAFGYSLQLDGYNAVTRYKDRDSFVSSKTFTLRLSNFDVENYGETALYASACMLLADGTLIQSEHVSATMRSVLEAISANTASYTEDQLAAVKAMIEKYPITKNWALENLA